MSSSFDRFMELYLINDKQLLSMISKDIIEYAQSIAARRLYPHNRYRKTDIAIEIWNKLGDVRKNIIIHMINNRYNVTEKKNDSDAKSLFKKHIKQDIKEVKRTLTYPIIKYNQISNLSERDYTDNKLKFYIDLLKHNLSNNKYKHVFSAHMREGRIIISMYTPKHYFIREFREFVYLIYQIIIHRHIHLEYPTFKDFLNLSASIAMKGKRGVDMCINAPYQICSMIEQGTYSRCWDVFILML
jgi:hypothetical protein